MKIKRNKQAKKILTFYKRNFGLREPFQVIVDGTFSQAALVGKILIKEQLPKYLGGEVQLVTTRCVISELSSLGNKLSGAMHIARRFKLRKCTHSGTLPAADCILALIGSDNPHHYLVASQDQDMRRKLRHLPGVPLMHIIRNTIVLEKPSDSTLDKAEDLTQSKMDSSSQVLDRLTPTSEQTKPTVRQRKKITKGPNPLSVKKSKKKPAGSGAVGGGLVSKSKKKRQRIQRKKALEILAQVVKSTNSQELVRTQNS
ncbi:rRNA-processing protein UTP23 homolog [Halichondria panicea]|uniref:rRNA-processing protein UTP23 homolog n=1 Tax=Halichondria panicea TaxID=6063 RepID=UPI00312B47EF